VCVEWCKASKEELKAAKEAGDNKFHQRYYWFLDEKWFYICSHKKKLKVLPHGLLERRVLTKFQWRERESSRHHTTKVMVLGAITDPVEEHNFDGKVYFTHVARTHKLKKTTYSDKIFDDLATNTALHHQWHGFVDQNESADQIISFVAGVFDIDEEMKQRLAICYKDHQDNGKMKWKEFSSFQTDHTISPQPNTQ